MFAPDYDDPNYMDKLPKAHELAQYAAERSAYQAELPETVKEASSRLDQLAGGKVTRQEFFDYLRSLPQKDLETIAKSNEDVASRAQQVIAGTDPKPPTEEGNSPTCQGNADSRLDYVRGRGKEATQSTGTE